MGGKNAAEWLPSIFELVAVAFVSRNHLRVMDPFAWIKDLVVCFYCLGPFQEVAVWAFPFLEKLRKVWCHFIYSIEFGIPWGIILQGELFLFQKLRQARVYASFREVDVPFWTYILLHSWWWS